jgi:Amt family ammonium transporter
MNVTNSTLLPLSHGNTAFMFVTTSQLLMICLAIGIFYSGMVRQKSAGSTVFQSFMILCVVSIVWWFIGFTLAFGDGGVFYGDFDFFMMIGFKTNIFTGRHVNAPTVPLLLVFLNQMMFAAITCALATGGMAERVKFK